MLIGVDHGNKQIKTVHCNPFVSGLKQSVTRPFGQNVLRYQNTYYTLSTERIPYRKDKTEDDRFFILTLFALAGEIEARGAYSSEVQRIQLAVGLPPAHFGAQVERFTQYFGQRGMVEFEVQGKPYSIYIEDVACFPQAYAAAVGEGTQAVFAPARGWAIFSSSIAAIRSGIAHIPLPIWALPERPHSSPMSTFRFS